MSTYTDAKKNFDRYFAEAVMHLGAQKYQPGLELNAVLSNPKDVLYVSFCGAFDVRVCILCRNVECVGYS